MPFVRTINSRDLVRLRAESVNFPADWPLVKIAKELSKTWKMKPQTLVGWLSLIRNIPEETIPFFDQLGKDKMSELGSIQVKNPSHKQFLIEKAVEERLTRIEICRIKDLVHRGRHPVEAIDIVQGRRPEKPLTKGDQLTLGKIIRDLERTGIDWRKTCELLRMAGKVQIVQNGRLVLTLLSELTAVKVTVEDMSRYIDDVMKDIPREIVDAFASEYRGPGKAAPKETRPPDPDPIMIDVLPAPKSEEAKP